MERERRNISLESVAEGTKVPTRHLLALESGDLQSLPGGVFSRGIVRSYCQFLGLDENEWLQRLPLPAHTESPQAWSEFATNVQRNRVRTTRQMRMRWWGVLLMLSVLGVLSWVAWKYVVQTQVLRSSSAPLIR